MSRPTALITGAAGGIGKALCARLSGDGFAICATDHPDALAGPPPQGSGRGQAGWHWLPSDLGAEAAADAIVGDCIAHFGRLDVLVNCAYWCSDAPLHEMDRAVWDQTILITLTAAAMITKAAVASMLRTGGGCVVNISSVQGAAAGAASPAYDVAKAGLNALTRSVAVNYGEAGIRCVGVCPGLIVHDGNAAELAGKGPAWMAAAQRAYPSSRPGTADDVAAAVSFVVSADAQFINGCIIPVDGGLLAMLPQLASTRMISKSNSAPS